MDTMQTRLSTTGYCNRWGSAWGARRVYGLSAEDRADVAAGRTVLIHGPLHRGCSERRVVRLRGRYYARMPEEKEVTG